MAKYLTINPANGRHTEKITVQTSAGAGDADKILSLDSTGRIDSSMMPTGIGADTRTAPAFEALLAGNLVNFFLDAGVTKVRKADASVAGKETDGYVLAAVASGANAIVYREGTNAQVTGLTIGVEHFLSATVPGAATTVIPSGSGNVVQYVGKAFSATELGFEYSRGTILA